MRLFPHLHYHQHQRQQHQHQHQHQQQEHLMLVPSRTAARLKVDER
jgi:hypothetical protein